VIPDEAIIKLNVRTFDEGVRKRVLAAIERIANAEAEASGGPKKPEITTLDRYSLVTNDPEATKRVSDAFRLPFSSERVQETKPTTANEDFGSFGAEWGVPSVFWFVGGIDSDMHENPTSSGSCWSEVVTRLDSRRPMPMKQSRGGIKILTLADRRPVYIETCIADIIGLVYPQGDDDGTSRVDKA
jgi:hypothetical protein